MTYTRSGQITVREKHMASFNQPTMDVQKMACEWPTLLHTYYYKSLAVTWYDTTLLQAKL